MRVAAGWNMPSQVRLSMQTSGVPAPTLDRSLASIANCGHHLTHDLYRKGVAMEKLHLETVFTPAGQPALLSTREVARIVDSAAVETSAMFSSLQASTGTLRLSRQAQQARTILDSIPIFDPAGLTTLDQAIQRAADALHKPDLDLTSFIASLLDAVCSAGFDRVIFGRINQNQTFVVGRLPRGEMADDAVNRFQFAIDGANGPIRSALQRWQDIYVDRARDGRYDASGLVAAFNPGGFALLPIVIDHKTVACLYADLHGSLHQMEAVRPAIGRVRDLITEAIRKQS
jgi:hypothetical protein